MRQDNISDQELLDIPLSKLSKLTGVPRSTLWGWKNSLQCHGLTEEDPSHHFPLEPFPEGDDGGLLNATAEMAEVIRAERGIQTSAHFDLSAETKPIGVAFTGDWHFGGLGVDYRQLYADLELLTSFPTGLYVFGMGDYGDNFKAGNGRSSTGLYDSVLPNPDDQQRGWTALLKTLAPKLLGLTLGCHLDWDYYKSGRDPLAVACAELGKNALDQPILNLGHGASIEITVGSEEYFGLVRHKLPGESALSTTNPHRRATNEYPQDEPFDFVALGHRHFNDLQVRTVAGRQRVWLRSGSYKVYDRYAQSLGGYIGEPGIPILILYPREHKMLAFWGGHLREAVSYLQELRK